MLLQFAEAGDNRSFEWLAKAMSRPDAPSAPRLFVGLERNHHFLTALHYLPESNPPVRWGECRSGVLARLYDGRRKKLVKLVAI